MASPSTHGGLGGEVAGKIPDTPGAYGLLISLAAPLTLDVGALGRVTFAAANHVYAGSAYGPGGLRARLARHLRPARRRHWHIDHLTEAAAVTAIFAVPGGRECDIVARVAAGVGAWFPVPGFGAGDCRTCASHLVAVAGDADGVATAIFAHGWRRVGGGLHLPLASAGNIGY